MADAVTEKLEVGDLLLGPTGGDGGPLDTIYTVKAAGTKPKLIWRQDGVIGEATMNRDGLPDGWKKLDNRAVAKTLAQMSELSLGVNELLAMGPHPLQVEVMRAFAEKDEWSPRELAEHLEQPLQNVSYHVRVLRDKGIIKESRTMQRRGAVQHFYKRV